MYPYPCPVYLLDVTSGERHAVSAARLAYALRLNEKTFITLNDAACETRVSLESSSSDMKKLIEAIEIEIKSIPDTGPVRFTGKNTMLKTKNKRARREARGW